MSNTVNDTIETELRRLTDRCAVLGADRLDGTPRGQAFIDAIQHIADITADTEGQPRRSVPYISSPTLAAQLTVVTRDALALGKETLAGQVAQALTQLRHDLA